MQQIKANQELKLTTSLEHSVQPVMQDKVNIYRHKISEEPLRVSASAPIRPQHFVQRQQYYTGDA
jgi:hypothetical protein